MVLNWIALMWMLVNSTNPCSEFNTGVMNTYPCLTTLWMDSRLPYTRSLPYALRTKTLHKHIFSPVSFLWTKTLLAVHITINLNSNNIRIWIQTIFVIEFIHHFKYWNLVCLSSSPLHDVFIDEFPLWVLYCIPKSSISHLEIFSLAPKNWRQDLKACDDGLL